MPKKRVSIPKLVTEIVMKEYRYRCAICGRHNPQLHHLDEDPSNNDPGNLLPLCPNCHLQDVHDPTNPPDLRKLRLFRVHKDPLILDPRFHPIFRRMAFLYFDEELMSKRPRLFSYRANELLDFVGGFEMGEFYKKKILDHLKNPFTHYAIKYIEGGTDIDENRIKSDPALKQAALAHRVEQIETLIIEALRYQNWVAKPFQNEYQKNE